MVSRQFVEKLNEKIHEDLGDVMTEEPDIQIMGSGRDQYKGLGDELKTRFIPFRRSEYQAEEYLFARISVEAEAISFFDFITPVVNIKGKTVQGVSSFVTYVPYPIPETFVQRMVGLSYQMVPHELVVTQGMKPKHVIKQEMIESDAINGINADKDLSNKLRGSDSCKVADTGFSNKVYKAKMDAFNYPPGMFTIVPFKGNSILIAKEAGEWGAKVDRPLYHFKERFEALAGVGSYVAYYPEEGEVDVGKFYMDSSLALVLSPLLEYLGG